MDEELTLERELGESQQRELIYRYCSNIETSISAAAKKSDAEKIVEEACQHFNTVCESKVVRRFLQHYVRRLFTKYWAQDK